MDSSGLLHRGYWFFVLADTPIAAGRWSFFWSGGFSGSWGLQPRSVGTGGSCLAALWEGVDGETDGWEGVCDVEVGWEVSRVVYVARLPPGRFFHRPLLSLSPAWIRLSGRGS